MNSFYYRAKRDPQTVVEGRIEAENRDTAISKLVRQGLFPTLVIPESQKKPRRLRLPLPSQAIRLKDKAHFSSQLHNLLSGGVPLLRALDILLNGKGSGPMKTVLATLHSDVREGKALSESLSHFSDWFGEFYVNLIKAGEASGGLESVLANLSNYLEKEIEIRTRFFQAMAYPIFVLAFGLLTLLVMVIGIVPRLSELYADMGGSLPLITRAVLGLSNLCLEYGWILLVFAVAAAFLLRGISRAKQGAVLDRLRLGIPLLGKIHQKDEIARATRALAILLQNGIPIIDALGLVASILTNGLMRREMENVKAEVAEGKALSQAWAAGQWFTPEAAQLVLVGEESGRLDQSFRKISEIYEKEVDQNMRVLTTLLEPALIVVIGGVVGVVVIAMLLPIFQMGLLAG